ncbi:MAG: MarR family transcriptional regulator [Chitinophagia bacterium]|jgi:MarR family transcriptional regulator, 2-MHQ and catechol-resistance regulon repressor|nr:MarR family transcriptional regulator [Chitinophagia bacterium]
MGIEKDINQHHFTSEGQKAIINLIYTTNWATEHIRGALDDLDITLQQFNILRILRGSDPKPLSTLTIRERMLDKMSDTSRIVDRLVLKGLAVKKTCPTDKRLVDVNITKEGKKILEAIDKKEAYISNITKNLTETELCQLNTLLDQLRSTP